MRRCLFVVMALLLSCWLVGCSSDDGTAPEDTTAVEDTGDTGSGTPDTKQDAAPEADTQSEDTEPIPDTEPEDTEDTEDTAAEDTEPQDVGEADAEPGGFGPASRVYSASLPQQDALDGCFDLDGDGMLDCGFCKALGFLEGLGVDLNQEIQAGVDEHFIEILLEFVGVTDFWNTPGFVLNSYAGFFTELDSEYWVQPSSYTPEGDVIVRFEDAAITDGQLSGEARTFFFSFPIVGVSLNIELSDARIGGSVAEEVPGVAVSSGVLGGVITREALAAALEDAKAYCDAAYEPKPQFCGYLDLMNPDMMCSLLIDCDMQGGESTSVCIKFNAEGAKIVGVAD